MANDEPIAKDAYDVAVAAQQMLVLAERLALQHGEEVVRDALLVAYATLDERTVGRSAMLEELRGKVAALLEHPTVADVISQCVH